jgi:hypothetical protein
VDDAAAAQAGGTMGRLLTSEAKASAYERRLQVGAQRSLHWIKQLGAVDPLSWATGRFACLLACLLACCVVRFLCWTTCNTASAPWNNSR